MSIRKYNNISRRNVIIIIVVITSIILFVSLFLQQYMISHINNNKNLLFIESNSNNNNHYLAEDDTEKILLLLRDHPHRGATDEYGNYGYIANVSLLRQWMLYKYCTIESFTTNNNNNNNSNNNNATSTITKSISTISPPLFDWNNDNQDNNYNYNTMLSCEIPFTNQHELDNVCNTPIQKGIEGKYGWDIMKNIIHIPIEDSMLLLQSPKILCSIYTYEQREDHIRGIAETWGWRCDGFFASSTKTKTKFKIMENNNNNNNSDKNNNYESPPVEMINLLHEGDEVYTNMWQKTRSILSYMYDHYLNEYDYFYLCGDDTHLIVENLKRFLIDYNNNNNTRMIRRNHLGTILLEPDHIFFTGQISVAEGNKYFANGGSGYVISRLALKRFVEDAIPYCYAHDVALSEDQKTSYCLIDFLNITFIDAADMNGKQRFHSETPNTIATGGIEVPDGAIWYERILIYIYMLKFYRRTANHWRMIHGNIKHSDIISPSSIAFHHFKSIISIKRHHIMLYYNNNHSHYYQKLNNETGACPIDSILSQALSS